MQKVIISSRLLRYLKKLCLFLWNQPYINNCGIIVIEQNSETMVKIIDEIVKEYNYKKLVYVSCRICDERLVCLPYAKRASKYWETREKHISEDACFFVFDDDVICGCSTFLGLKINNVFFLTKRSCKLSY